MMIDTSDLELSIVGGLMIDDSQVDHVIRCLHEEHFINSKAKTIFNAINGLWCQQMPIDATLVASYLTGDGCIDRVYEHDVYKIASEAPNPKNIGAYVDMLLNHREEDERLKQKSTNSTDVVVKLEKIKIKGE